MWIERKDRAEEKLNKVYALSMYPANKFMWIYAKNNTAKQQIVNKHFVRRMNQIAAKDNVENAKDSRSNSNEKLH